MSSLRLAVLGCGQISLAAHLPALESLNASVVGLADASSSRLQLASQRFPGAICRPDASALLREVPVDAVVIGLPPAMHAPLAVQAFELGAHVYVEKPVAIGLTESLDVLRAWRAAGTVGMMGFNFRFHPQVQTLRAQVKSGAIGTPLLVRCTFTILPHEIPEWKRSRETGGGVLLDLASHHLDLVQYVLDDEITQVSATVRSLRSAGDHATLQLTCASGTMAQLFVSLGSVEEHRVEVIGTAAKLTMDRTELRTASQVMATQRGARAQRLRRTLEQLDPRLILRSPGHEPSFRSALAAFLAAAGGSALSAAPIRAADIRDGVRVQALIDAAERSAASGALERPAVIA